MVLKATFKMRKLLFVCALLLPLPLLAQFDGGPGDGFDQKQESSITLTGSILSFGGFNGGNGDGFDIENQASITLLGTIIPFNGFDGGIGDGFDIATESSRILAGGTYTYAGFNGGTGDGFAFTQQAGLILQNTPLPIYWIDFDAQMQQQIVLLNWEMINTEEDDLHFEIERSVDAIHFEKIIEIKTQPNSANSYFTHDKSPSLGNNYYRIKHISPVGEIQYTQIEKVHFYYSRHSPSLEFYPNPCIDRKIKCKITGIPNDKQYVLNVYNLLGVRLLNRKTKNEEELLLPGQWVPGMYWFETIQDDFRLRQAIILK